MPEPIRLLLVDDDPLVVAGLRLLFVKAEDIDVVGETSSGAAAVDFCRTHRVDAVLMDLRMPGMSGIEATRAIRALPHPPEVIALTTWDVDDAVTGAIEAGADGFLLKTTPPAEILDAVRAVVSGDGSLSPRSTRQLLDHIRRDHNADARRAALGAIAALTDREREIAVEVGRGLSNADIGASLFISAGTVKSHLATIQTKLGVDNRVGIAVLAERAGLLNG